MIIIEKSQKNHNYLKSNYGLTRGVAENRTRVQTSNQVAFYTFIFCLIFRSNARPETATSPLVFLIFVIA